MAEAVLDLGWVVSVTWRIGLSASNAISVLVFVCKIKFVSIFINFAGDARLHAWWRPSVVVVVISFASVYHLVQLCSLLSTESESNGQLTVRIMRIASSGILVVCRWDIILVNFVSMMRFLGSHDLIRSISALLSN